jgi:NAD(P)H-nitrite reductase large subunit
MESKEQENSGIAQDVCYTDCMFATEEAGTVMQALAISEEFTITRVKTCGGSAFCPRGKQDSLDLGLKLEERLHKIYLPTKLCIGVFGCSNHCAETCKKDIGIAGTVEGWDIFIDGDSCQRNAASQLAKGLSTQKVLAIVDRIVAFFRTENCKNNKLKVLIEEKGFENFKAKVLNQTECGKS